MKIKELFKKFGKIKSVKKGEYLYKQDSNDKNIYFITKGKLLLLSNNEKIAIVGENEISGEKSFLEKKAKPIDAKAITDTKTLYIDSKTFDNMQLESKNEFLKELTLFISNRVYLLNDVINSISQLNKKISSIIPKLSIDFLNEIFSHIFTIKNAYIYKEYSGTLLTIFKSNLDDDIRDNITSYNLANHEVKLQDDKLLIKAQEYLMYLDIEKKKSEYVIINSLIHSLATIKSLCYMLDEENTKNLNNLLK